MLQMRNPFFRNQQPASPPAPPPDFGFKYPEQQEQRPMLEAYKQLLGNAPTHQPPGILRGILSSLVGGAAGFTGGAAAGMQAGNAAMEAPYEKSMQDFGTKLKGAEAGVQLENTGIEDRNRYFRDFNTAKSHEVEAGNLAADNVRKDQELELARGKQDSVQAYYDSKNKRDEAEFEAKKSGGYFHKYPPKYIGDPGGGAGKPPTQTNMQKAEQAVTEQIVATDPQFEQFVQRDPHTGRITTIKGPADNNDPHQLVKFTNFMNVRGLLAKRRLGGGFGMPASPDNHAALTGNSEGSQTSSHNGPDAEYEY